MVVLGVALALGAVVFAGSTWALRRWPGLDPGAPAGAVHAVGRQVEAIEAEVHLGFVQRRLDPRTETGLALTVAAVVVALGGAVLAVLSLVVRSNAFTLRVDRGVTNWAGTNASDWSTSALRAVTQLGGSVAVIVLAVAIVVIAATAPGTWRPSLATVVAFVVTVVVGQNLISNLVKLAVDRARPTFHPLAGFSGPSFPSGHTTAAFACYCAFALVLGRGRRRDHQILLLAGALGLANLVIGASRVLLGVHWLTDVLAGASLGLAWFTLVAIAFGGRLLRFGAPVIAGERAAHLAEVHDAGKGAPPSARDPG